MAASWAKSLAVTARSWLDSSAGIRVMAWSIVSASAPPASVSGFVTVTAAPPSTVEIAPGATLPALPPPYR